MLSKLNFKAVVLRAPVRLSLLSLHLLVGSTASADIRFSDWCEYRSPAYRLLTDLPAPLVAELHARLARLPPVIEALLADSGQEPRATQAQLPQLLFIVFRRQRDYAETVASGHFSGYMQPSLAGNRIVLGAGRNRAELFAGAQHEYAHHLLRVLHSEGLPLWYEEGLASLSADVRWSENRITLQPAPKGRSLPVRSSTTAKLKRMLTAQRIDDWSATNLQYFYGASQLLARRIHSTPEWLAGLSRYLENPRDLFVSLKEQPRRMNRDLLRAAERGRTGEWIRTATAPRWKASARAQAQPRLPSRQLLHRAIPPGLRPGFEPCWRPLPPAMTRRPRRRWPRHTPSP